jgi:hypothetical protein
VEKRFTANIENGERKDPVRNITIWKRFKVTVKLLFTSGNMHD